MYGYHGNELFQQHCLGYHSCKGNKTNDVLMQWEEQGRSIYIYIYLLMCYNHTVWYFLFVPNDNILSKLNGLNRHYKINYKFDLFKGEMRSSPRNGWAIMSYPCGLY